MEPKVIVADLGRDYDGITSDKLLAYDVSELPSGIVDEILELINKHHSKKLTEYVNNNNYFSIPQVKEKFGWSVTNKDNLLITTSDRYANVYSVQKFDEKYLESYIKGNGKDIDVSKLRVFTEVSLPESIQNQINAISNKIEKEKQQKEIKKAQKRLERAKKILESNGKLT
jgi:hypothetical protein